MSATMEIAKSVHANLPYVLALSGALYGAVSGRPVHDEIAKQRAAWIQDLEDDKAGSIVSQEEDLSRPNEANRKQPIREYAGSPVIASLMAAYAIAGFSAGSVLDKGEEPRTVPPTVGLVAPMPGTVGTASDENSSYNQIVQVRDDLQAQDNVDTMAVVARAGGVESGALNEIPASGLGAALMGAAIKRGVEEIRNKSLKQGGEKSNAALIVAVKNDKIGSSRGIIKAANDAEVRAPVYFVDVSTGKSGIDKKKLQDVAEQTGGEYFSDVEKRDITRILSEVQEAEIDTGKGGTDLDPIVLAGLTTASAIFWRKKLVYKMPLQYHGGK